MLFTGRLIGGAEAHALGLVNRLVPADEIERDRPRARGRDCRQRAVDAARDEGNDPPRPRASAGSPPASDADIVEMCYTSGDFREGVTAFLAKRKPVWSGS